MIFAPGLRRGVLLRRYKRFLADVRVAGGPLTIHCPNTGAMTGCATPGGPVWFSTSTNPKRKYAHTWELARSADDDWIGINPTRANAVVAEAIAAGRLDGFPAESRIDREVTVPGTRRRLDLRVGAAFVEVKSVTLKVSPGVGAFPDAVSARATRHVELLTRLARAGRAAALVFCVLHTGIRSVRPADEIDAAYGVALRVAAAAGVRLLALGCDVSPGAIIPRDELPVAI